MTAKPWGAPARQPMCKPGPADSAQPEEARDGRTNLLQTASNMINCFIGAGILTVPFAFRLAGYGAAAALVMVASLNWATSLLLGHALAKAARLRPDVPAADWDLKALGGVVFGATGRQVVSGLLALEVWVALETFLILTGINIHLLTGAPRPWVIVIAGCLGTWSLSLPMSMIARLSCLSVWCMLGALVSLAICGGLLAASPQLAMARHDVLNLEALPSAVAILSYAFSGLPCLPNIRAGMRNTAEYSNAVNIAFAFSVPYYLTIGLLGYYFFGSGTRESFTLNYVEYPGMPHRRLFLVFSLASSALFAAKLQAGFPLYAAPVLQALGFGATGADIPPRVAVARVAFAVFSVVFAVFARDALCGVAEIMGALLTMSTSVLFPVVAYAGARHTAGEPLLWREALGLGGIFSIGLALAAFDIYRKI